MASDLARVQMSRYVPTTIQGRARILLSLGRDDRIEIRRTSRLEWTIIQL